MEVLFEQQSDGVWSGLTNNYIRVHINSDEDLNNKLLPVKLTTSGKKMLGGAIAT
jgi:threonylcarbamoyladenosine tRNA methylthiotransferase MtaB